MASASCSGPNVAGGGARAARSGGAPKLTCLCSPTDHPGSFRCSRHRNSPRRRAAAPRGEAGPRGRGAANKGWSVRALLLQRIGPSDRDRQHRHRGDFQPRPSRLRLMNM